VPLGLIRGILYIIRGVDRVNTDTKEVYFLRNTFWEVGKELLDSKSKREQRFGQFLTELGYLVAYDIDVDTFSNTLKERVDFALNTLKL